MCIVSTHLGKGFAPEGELDPVVDATLGYLAERPGWYVPVSTLLDHLREQGGAPGLGGLALLRLELRFLVGQIRERLAGELS